MSTLQVANLYDQQTKKRGMYIENQQPTGWIKGMGTKVKLQKGDKS